MIAADPASGAELQGEASSAQLLGLAESIDAKVERELNPESPGGSASSSPSAPAPIPLERELAGMFAMIGAGVGQFLPSVKLVLEESTCKQLGDALAPLARKYGLDRHLAGFAWRAELQALMVVVPVGLAIAGAVKNDLAQYRKAAAAAQPGAAGAGAGVQQPQQDGQKSPQNVQPPMLTPVP